MSLNSVDYYYSGNNMPVSAWQVNYSFSGLSGVAIPSVTGANYMCSGRNFGNVYLNTGTGFFDGVSLLKVSNSTGDLTDWTIICQLEKNSFQDGIFFSSFTSGAINSGFSLGINGRNRAYLDTYDENSFVSYTSDIILGPKNLIAFTKVAQGLYFDYFNANAKTVESQQFDLSDKGCLTSSNWYVGGFSGAPIGYSGKMFSGMIYDFLLFNNPLRPEEIRQLFIGLTSTGDPPSYHNPYISGLGMNRVSFAKDLNLRDRMELYIMNSAIDYKTGSNLDADFDGTVSEFYADMDIAENGIVGYLNGVALFGHTGYTTNSDFYNLEFFITGSFLPSGNKFFTKGNTISEDRIVYDIYPEFNTTGSGFWYQLDFSWPGSGSDIDVIVLQNGSILLLQNGESLLTQGSGLFATGYVFDMDFAQHALVFFNGVKLISGVDYSYVSGSGIVIDGGNPLYEGITGTLFSYPYDAQYSYVGVFSGINFNNSLNKYGRGTSLLWQNGIRQNLGETYFETATWDLINGTGIPSGESILFFE